jgi:hypothetical protein
MTAEKKSVQEPGVRRAWTSKSPVEVVLEQITKQEKKVAGLQRDLEDEKVILNKLLQAKKVLEAT